MNILVTGHKGFVGRAMVERLKGEGHFVVGLDNKKYCSRDLKDLADVFIKGDVVDYELMRRTVVDYEIEEIYHFASRAINGNCANDPLETFRTNLMGMVNVLEVCRNYGKFVKNIVISTSDKAFGASHVPYTEENELKPLFIYDTSKACQQLIALSYFRNYGLPVKVVACSNIYGPKDPNFSRVIPMTVTRLAQGKPARLWKDSEDHVREFVYIDDVIDAFLKVGKDGVIGEIYCCGGTEHLTIKELMIKICSLMEKDSMSEIKIFERPSVSLMEIEEQYIDSSKLKSIGWFPHISLHDGLKKTIDYYINLAE